MITSKECAFINKIKSHTESTVEENQNKFLPVFNTGKIFNTNKYHYLDRNFSYAYSADEPDKAYGIIYVENMPYRSLFKRRSNSSFVSTIERMVYDSELVPFILFINRRFIPWEKIQIIHDYKDTWLRINDYRYNYYSIKNIDMIILPYNISYLSVEPDHVFDRNFEALKAYINDSAVIRNDRLFINIPYTNDDYTYDRNTYNVGYWMYNQIRLKKLNMLPDDRYEKLRKISVTKNNDDESLAFSNTVNIFDRDSYIQSDIDSICNIDENNVLFKFNDDGELSDDGDKILYLIDKNEISVRKYNSYDSSIIIGQEPEIPNKISERNIIVFRNKLLCDEYDILFGEINSFLLRDKDSDMNNVFPALLQAEIVNGDTEPQPMLMALNDDEDDVIYSTTNVLPAKLHAELNSKIEQDPVEPPEESVSSYIMYLFYKEEVETAICHKNKFSNIKYLADKGFKYFLYKDETAEYVTDLDTPLDFKLSNNIIYDKNFDDAFKSTMYYDPALLNGLYEHGVITKCMTGKEANERLDLTDGRRGLIISSINYEYHETYALVFVNGELIKTYSDMHVYANYLFVPVDWTFNDDDTIEFLYFLNVNNNELHFTYDKNSKMFEKVIPKDELKLFSTDVDDMLVYKDPKYNLDNISFPVYDLDETNTNKLNGREVVAVSSRKFIYQRLYVDQKSYKVILNKRFRYCDDQGQYLLFINGRIVSNSSFLITIPKITRPFDNMYIYTGKFFNPDDRIELFYLPHKYININKDQNIVLDKSGYITCDKTILDFPLSTDNYVFFINGKKIPKDNVVDVSTNIVRIKRDTNTVNRLDIFPIVTNDITYMKDYLHSSNKSKNELVIDQIIENNGYTEIDYLLKEYITMSDNENIEKIDVDHIALVNEIVRDFWVSTGYDYNAKPFIYDYELDDYITTDDNGNKVIPALDAFQEININKTEMRYLYFRIDGNSDPYFEIGRTFVKPYLEWEYSMPPYSDKPYDIKYQKLNGEDIATNLRIIQLNKTISSDEKFIIEGSNGFTECESTLDIKFCNGIYYGLVDEDLLDNRESDIYTNNPSQLLKDITKELKPDRTMDFTDYIIGNNKYFIFALPKRLAYDENGNELITFFLPDIKSDVFLDSNIDDKTIPVFTNGKYVGERYDSNGELIYRGELVALDSFRMELLADFSYTNGYNYTEDYVIFKSNGFFTRLYDDTKFNIYIR